MGVSPIAQAVPRVAVFDVNETLSDLGGLVPRLTEVGAPPDLLPAWFAATLRDGFALTAAGAYAGFRSVAAAVLGGQLAQVEALRRPAEDAVEYVLDGFAELDVHPDVAEGMRRLAQAGVLMVTLSNGAAEVATTLLERAALADLVERFLSVDEVQRWKPAPEPYLYAARACGVPPERCALMAVHPWDIDGAKRAGLQAGWLDRRNSPYPAIFRLPDASGESLGTLADALLLSA